eukprot:TRINITY_DN1130_c0_g2_i3.p1 TRINITY_DN1130_c0_g2~~TRINITY_DN1130_c0_g2_i3.p1  ORF type:complete len:345 (+),score=62.88 TRINITY_DN1130_c0_g2_i3:677-1711(+)
MKKQHIVFNEKRVIESDLLRESKRLHSLLQDIRTLDHFLINVVSFSACTLRGARNAVRQEAQFEFCREEHSPVTVPRVTRQMADSGMTAADVELTHRLESHLRDQKQDYEERNRLLGEEHDKQLRVQKDECEERLLVLREKHEGQLSRLNHEHEETIDVRMKEVAERLKRDLTTACEERLRVQKEECEERLRVQEGECEGRLKQECEERLRVQKEKHDTELFVQTERYFPGYYPLPLEELPLEIIALIADFVYACDHKSRHLYTMMLVSRRLHDGVSLSGWWCVVTEVGTHVEGVAERRNPPVSCERYQVCDHFLRECAPSTLRMRRARASTRMCALSGGNIQY